MEFDFTKELEEVKDKSDKDIEKESAIRWAKLSVACFSLALEAKEELETLNWVVRASDYYHEFLEHSVLSEDLEFMKELKMEVDNYRNQFTL
jgi:hypothetical protein